MKATLEFNLPEEAAELRDAQRGTVYKGKLLEIREEFRGRAKYGDETISTEEAYRLVLDLIGNTLEDEQ